MNNTGILVIAIGSDFYSRLAYALAKSLKKFNKLPIALITDSYKDDNKIFDYVVEANLSHYLDSFVMNPFKLKTFIYDYSPFENTLYLDADTLCLKPLDGLFEQLGDFQIHEFSRWNKDNWQKCPMVWVKKVNKTVEDIYDAYGLDKTREYPEYNSSFIWFKKNETNKAYFDQVKKNYTDRRIDFKDIGGSYPDEMAYNLASVQKSHYGPLKGFKPVYYKWETERKGSIPAINDLKEKYYFLGMAGGYHASNLVNIYHRLCKDLGINMKFDSRAKIFHRKI